jgi:hypothetical protein
MALIARLTSPDASSYIASHFEPVKCRTRLSSLVVADFYTLTSYDQLPSTTVLQNPTGCRMLSIKGLFSWYFDLPVSGFAFTARRGIRRKIKGFTPL